ncbi:glucosaminidase domain-containing protein [Globicatella sanguinis]|uniref:glucosaminidase domain-containing protein n=1 Tax=Globicatella sanguinis TaxID=13076 RepID=UPI000825996F|nr:glucosaminidase domain-containing protein [Globicatella sanguinis]
MTTGSLYLDSIKAGAIRGWIEERIPASLTGAQAALESGWGTSSLARAPHNNQFGIKASADWTGRVVKMPTKEYLNGSWTTVNADFRAYDDINDSVADHAKFFTSTEWRKSNYKAVIGETDYKKACYAVKAAGYATDPDYASKLINIIEKYKLYEWDTEAQNGSVPTASEDVEIVSDLQPKSKIVGGDLSEAGRAFSKQTGVSVIGDSLGVGTEPHLVKLIPNSNYDVKGSRQITHSDSSLNGTVSLQNMKNAGKLKDNVVVILGTNRGLTAGEIDTFMSICGTERKVLWVETASAVRHNLSANEEMRKAATRHKNAFVLGWYDMVGGLRKEYYGSDDIHMTYMGYFNHAKAIVQGVYEMSTGDFDSSVAETTTMQFEGIKGFKLSEDGKLEYTDENKVKQVIQTEFKGLSTDGKSNYIYNVSANNAYNPQTGATEADWLEGRFESSELKGLDLFMAACRDMMNRGEPEATYRVVLSELPKGIEIGAEGTIVDTASNPPRYITARVSEITTSQTNPEFNEVVITNVVEVKPFEKPTTLLIQEELRKNRDKLDTDYKERILESDLNSMGGLVLATEDSETTLIADVEVEGENVTEHYSDFRWERQSNNAESDKHYNEILSKTENGMTLNVSDKDIEGEESNFICRIYDDAGNLVRTIMKKMVSQVKIKKEIDTVLDRFDTERTETEQAITEALESAKAEAERLDEERQQVIEGKFEVVNKANEKLEQSIKTAEQNAQSALQKAGASEDLAKTAKEVSENAIANLGTVKTELGEVKTQASDSVIKAQEALDTAGTLSTQVKSYEETVDGYKSEVANYSRTNETLTAKVKSYEETVDGYSQTLTRVEGKIDGGVGGRNLIIGSETREFYPYQGSNLTHTHGIEVPEWHASDAIKVTGTTGSHTVFATLSTGRPSATDPDAYVKEGEPYTYSIYFKNDGANDITVNSNGNVGGDVVKSGELKRVVLSDYVPETGSKSFNQFTISTTVGSTVNFTYWHPQIEKGLIVSDWKLALEDTLKQSEFKSYKNEVTSTTTEHTRRLTALDGDGGRISKVEQTATQIQRSLSNYAPTTYVDTKITEKAGEITTNLTKVVEGKVDNLQIGTRNLLSNTETFEPLPPLITNNPESEYALSGSKWLKVGDVNGTVLIKFAINDTIKQGDIFAVSFIGQSWNSTTSKVRFKVPWGAWSETKVVGKAGVPTYNIFYVQAPTIQIDDYVETNHFWMEVEYPFYFLPKSLKIERGNKPTDWSQAPEDNVTKTEFQTVKETTSLYERTIGTTEAKIKSNIAKITMTNSLFQKEVSKNADVSNTKSQVTQLANSWALTLKSGNDIKTAINATTDGIRLKGSLITLDGLVNMTSSFIVPEGNIGNLSAKKITSGTIDTARLNSSDIVTKGLTSNVVKSDHILADNALFKKLFTNDLATQNLATKRAWIKSGMIGDAQIGTAQIGQIDASNGKIVNFDARYITANHAELITAGFNGLNSRTTVDGTGINVTNTDGEFISLNNNAELRSRSSDGNYIVLGNGRLQVYNPTQNQGYFGVALSDADGSKKMGVYMPQGSSGFQIARNMQVTSQVVDGKSYTVTSANVSGGWSSIVDSIIRLGIHPSYNSSNVNHQRWLEFSKYLQNLNGWTSTPNLRAGSVVMVTKTVKPAPSSGTEWRHYVKFDIDSKGQPQSYFYEGVQIYNGMTIQRGDLWIKSPGRLRNESDRRVKENIEASKVKALDEIRNLEFVQFDKKADGSHQDVGLIAQDSGKFRVIGEETEAVDVLRLIYTSAKAIQELERKVKELEEQNETLRNHH